MDAAYVGRLGRHLLQQLDLAEPVNFNDPKGGGDYFTAGTQMSKMTDQLNGSCLECSDGVFQHLPTIQYFEDVFPQMASRLKIPPYHASGLCSKELGSPFRTPAIFLSSSKSGFAARFCCFESR